MIYVTHDQTEAMTMGDRIAVFNVGRIEQVGAPMDLYQQPVNRFVAQFLGSPRMNILPATIERGADGSHLRIEGMHALEVPVPEGLDVSRCVEVGVRPECLQVGHVDVADGWSLKLDLVERLGDTTLLYSLMPHGGDPLCVKVATNAMPLNAGDPFNLKPMPGALHLFDDAGQRIAVI
jgi:multiple sugar transport system ATP-binding protein